MNTYSYVYFNRRYTVCQEKLSKYMTLNISQIAYAHHT